MNYINTKGLTCAVLGVVAGISSYFLYGILLALLSLGLGVLGIVFACPLKNEIDNEDSRYVQISYNKTSVASLILGIAASLLSFIGIVIICAGA